MQHPSLCTTSSLSAELTRNSPEGYLASGPGTVAELGSIKEGVAGRECHRRCAWLVVRLRPTAAAAASQHHAPWAHVCPVHAATSAMLVLCTSRAPE